MNIYRTNQLVLTLLRNGRLTKGLSVMAPASTVHTVANANQLCSNTGKELSVVHNNRLTPKLHNMVLSRFSSGGKPHSHKNHFLIERAWAIAMLPLFPTALFVQSPFIDYALAVAVALHTHWGLETVAVDYVRPYVVGETLAKLVPFFIYGVSAVLLAGLLNFNYNDVGICKAFQLIWSL